MKPCFSVRNSLLSGDLPHKAFQNALIEARRFLESVTVTELLEFFFSEAENRRTVIAAVRDLLHVGFIAPEGELPLNDMIEAALLAGLEPEGIPQTSTVVARELGVLVGRDTIQTTIFTAHCSAGCFKPGYVEVFLPVAYGLMRRKWIDEEICTHCGFTLVDDTVLPLVHKTFLEEGFVVPSFFCGRPIANPDKKIAVIYYDQLRNGRIFRIEILSPNYGS